MVTTIDNNQLVVSCLISHRPAFVIAMADTVAVGRPGFVDHRVIWGSPGLSVTIWCLVVDGRKRRTSAILLVDLALDTLSV